MSFFNAEINIPSNNGKSIQLRAPDGLSSNHSFFLPSTIGASGNILAITSVNGTDNIVGFTSDLSVNSVDVSNIIANDLTVNATNINATNLNTTTVNCNNINSTNLIDASGLNANNLSLVSDSAIISFGADSETFIKHVNNTGIEIEGSATAGGIPVLTINQPGSSSVARIPHSGLEFFVPAYNVGTPHTHSWMIYGWNLSNNSALYFSYQKNSTGFTGGDRGYISSTTSGQMNFTGQHRNIMNTNITDSSVGLIVSTTGKFVNTDNSLEVSINESLPVCVITKTDNDKKVFGVLSDKEDTNSNREYSSGNFVSIYNKQNTNEQRMFINSVGEGGIWVSNKNGNIENGDYITSSTVPGYGVKQADDLLHNYTVAKITCDCDFSTTQIVKQKLKVISTTDADGNTTTEIDYDANGDVQYEDDLDENGNQQMVYPLETRFLEEDGSQITEAQYTTKLANGENVYIACFVGCTYHCG